MAWYKSGSVSVTNGNATVYGNGTLWVDVSVLTSGDVWVGPDGRLYEIASFQSNTQLTLASAYLGATANAQSYAIMPIGLLPSALAQQVKTTLSTANTALSQAVRFDANQNLTSGQKATARANIGATAAADVGLGLLSKSVAGGVDIVLSTDEAANLFYEFAGALTANINVIVPGNVRQFFARNATSGAYTLTVKTQSGAGFTIPQGARTLLECDGTSVIPPTSLQSLFTVDGSNNLGVGTNSPAFGVDINTNVLALGPKTASAGKGGNVRLRDDAGVPRWLAGILGTAAATSFDLYDIIAGASRMTVDANGNVGVNTTTPQYKFHVKGTVGLDSNVTVQNLNSDIYSVWVGGSTDAGVSLGSNASSVAMLSAYNKAYSTTRDLAIQPSGGRVGIGSTSPLAKLHVGAFAGTGATLADTVALASYSTTAQFRLLMNHAGSGILGIGSDGVGGLIFGQASDFNGTIQLEKMRLDAPGNLLVGTTSGSYKVTAAGAIYSTLGSGGIGFSGDTSPDTAFVGYNYANVSGTETVTNSARASWRMAFGNGVLDALTFGRRAASAAASSWTEFGRFDNAGNFIVGSTGGSCHKFVKPSVAVGNAAFYVSSNNDATVGFGVSYIDGGGWSTQGSGVYVGKYTTTGRSINAGGTINASGADYAEYMTKADDCGVIAKGQIVGVNVEGKLTDKWADAVSFLIKSTDPSYVGGDVWGSEEELGAKRPVAPVLELPVYSGPAAPQEPAVVAELTLPPVNPGDDADDATKAAYEQALVEYEHAEAVYSQYQIELAAYRAAAEIYTAAQNAHATDVSAAQQHFDSVITPAYQAQLSAFEIKLEFARQRVDRIAYCGQVPVNVTGATPGQYVVPVQDGDGIAGQLVDDEAITFAQYRRAVGIVQNILPDGRANVRVKVA